MAILGSESLAAKLSLFFVVACIGGWVFAMSSDQWVMKKNPYYRLEGGLFQIEVKKGYIALLGGALLDPVTGAGLVWLNTLLAKKFGVEEFREYMCALPKLPGVTDNVCFIAQWLQLATWTVLFCVGLSFVVLGAGGYLLYWYVYVKPRTVVRRWMKIAFMVAPLLQFGPLALYIFAAMQVEEIFPRMSGAHLGHSILFASTASFMSLVPSFIVTAFLGRLLEEEFNEAASEQKKLMREDPELYGTAAAGGAPPQTAPPSGYMVQQQQQYMASLSAQSQPGANVFAGAYQSTSYDAGQGGAAMSGGMYGAYGAGYPAGDECGNTCHAVAYGTGQDGSVVPGGAAMSSGVYGGEGYPVGDPSGSAYHAGAYGAGQGSGAVPGGAAMSGGISGGEGYPVGDPSGGAYHADAYSAEQDSAAVPGGGDVFGAGQFVPGASSSEYATAPGVGYGYEHAAQASGYAGTPEHSSGQAGTWEQLSEVPAGTQYVHSMPHGSAQ